MNDFIATYPIAFLLLGLGIFAAVSRFLMLWLIRRDQENNRIMLEDKPLRTIQEVSLDLRERKPPVGSEQDIEEVVSATSLALVLSEVLEEEANRTREQAQTAGKQWERDRLEGVAPSQERVVPALEDDDEPLELEDGRSPFSEGNN